VDGAAHLVTEYLVDQLVLLDAAEALELVGHDLGAEVVSAPRCVLNGDLCTGQGLLYALSKFFCAWHGYSEYRRKTPIQSAQMVQLTDIAAQKVQEFMSGQGAEGDVVGLRVGVKGGGCSGFQYALALDEKRDDDHIFEISGIRVLVDPASMQYVDGSTVDFTESFMGSGFEVSNPNVVASCGCGSSFRVAEEEPSCGASV
jgi:iron-sulfur cluster assembly accessory protein